MSTSFTVERRSHREGAAALLFGGELDMRTAPVAAQHLEGAERDSRQVLLDLRALSFIDSSGLHAIVASNQRLRQRGGELAVVCGPGAVDRMFKLTNMDQVLRIVDDPDAAFSVRE